MFKKILQLSILGIFLFGFSLQAQAAWSIANRQFEKDGVPTFLWGIMSKGKTEVNYQTMATTGFNFYHTWGTTTPNGPEDVLDNVRWVNNLNMGLVVNISSFVTGYESDLLPTWLSGAELTEAQASLISHGQSATGNFCGAFYRSSGFPQSIKTLTSDQHLQLTQEYYNKNESVLTTVIDNATTTDNLIGFALIDEPIGNSISGPSCQLLGTLLSDLVHSRQPNAKVMSTYHPINFKNPERPLTQQPAWTAWSDVLGADNYVTPSYPGIINNIDYITNNVGRVELVAASEGKPTWTILATDANTDQMLSQGDVYTEEMVFLHTYAAIIGKVKGIVHWMEPYAHPDTTPIWFTNLSTRIKTLGPIAVSPEIIQTVSYNQPFALGNTYDSGEFPDVVVRLFNNPTGGYVVLAANAEKNPISIDLKLNLFENGSTVSRLFSPYTFDVSGNSINDILEVNGVRAYTFTSSVPIGTGVNIDVVATDNYEIVTRADVDQSGVINSTDAMLTLRNSLGLTMFSTNWQASSTTGDADCSSSTNSTDALLILRDSLGLDMSSTGWCVS